MDDPLPNFALETFCLKTAALLRAVSPALIQGLLGEIRASLPKEFAHLPEGRLQGLVWRRTSWFPDD